MRPPRPLPKHDARWVNQTGMPATEFEKYMRDQDQVVRLLVAKIEDLEIRVNDLENP